MAWAHAGRRAPDDSWAQLLQTRGTPVTVTSISGTPAQIYADRDRNGAQGNIVHIAEPSYFTEPGQYNETAGGTTTMATILPDSEDLESLLASVPTAPAWTPSTPYQAAQVVTTSGTAWACMAAATSRGAFDAVEQANWVQLSHLDPEAPLFIDGGSA